MARQLAAAAALVAYGVGLPAMAMIRIVQSTFYARHDTMTPVRATVTAIAVNIALKMFFVWGLHMGVAGMALGTAIGAWINVGMLTWLGRSRDLLAIEKIFLQRPAGCVAGGAGLRRGRLGWRANLLQGRMAMCVALAAAILLCGIWLWRGAVAVPQPPAAAAQA